jgi:peptidoglycan/xylan/chitin deacetylase (PgdA/CDA1 family)
LIAFYNYLEIPVTFAVRGQIVETESDMLTRLLDSPIKHDIAGHGYYHRTFSSISDIEAQNELRLLSIGFKKFNINPRSFVFPKNRVGHLSLLENHGFKCYRGEGGFLKDELSIKKQGHLYDIRPSFHTGLTYNPIFLKKIVDISCNHKLPFHIWFHPRDVYETKGRSTERNIERVLLPIYRYAKKKEKCGALSFETMHSVIEKP